MLFSIYDLALRKTGHSIIFTRYTIPFYLLVFICDLLIFLSDKKSNNNISFKNFMLIATVSISAIAIFLPYTNIKFKILKNKSPLLNFFFYNDYSINYQLVFECFVVIIISIIFNILFTSLLSKITKIESSNMIKEMNDNDKFITGINFGENYVTRICSTLKPAIIEEILFRHAVLNIINHLFFQFKLINYNLYSLILTNIFFALIHLNMINNNAIKFLQTFIIGIIFTIIYIHYGLEMSIISHGLTNITFVTIKILYNNPKNPNYLPKIA